MRGYTDSDKDSETLGGSNMETPMTGTITKAEIKARVLDRLASPIEWPDNGMARMGLLQVAFDQGWYLDIHNWG